MPEGVIGPGDLAMLAGVLEAHCQARHIADGDGRERAALLILALFDSGITTAAELSAALERADPNPLG